LRRLARDSQQFLSSFRRPLSARRRPGPEEAIQGERSQAEIAWAYEGHPVTVSNWTTQFMEEGAKVFGGVGRAETPAEKDRRPRATCEGQLDLVKSASRAAARLACSKRSLPMKMSFAAVNLGRLLCQKAGLSLTSYPTIDSDSADDPPFVFHG